MSDDLVCVASGWIRYVIEDEELAPCEEWGASLQCSPLCLSLPLARSISVCVSLPLKHASPAGMYLHHLQEESDFDEDMSLYKYTFGVARKGCTPVQIVGDSSLRRAWSLYDTSHVGRRYNAVLRARETPPVYRFRSAAVVGMYFEVRAYNQ